MTLIKCPECEKSISDKATECPQCGYPIPKTPKPTKNCPNCGKKMDIDEVKCPHCKLNFETSKKLHRFVIILFIIGIPISLYFTFFNKSDPTEANIYQSKTNYNTRTTKVVKWYEGGTLHKGAVQDWKNATYPNKLATCADLACSRPQIKKELLNSSTMEPLKKYANQLITCLDEACAGEGYENQKIASLAAVCMMQMGW